MDLEVLKRKRKILRDNKESILKTLIPVLVELQEIEKSLVCANCGEKDKVMYDCCSQECYKEL
jgi:hypothetical protein